MHVQCTLDYWTVPTRTVEMAHVDWDPMGPLSHADAALEAFARLAVILAPAGGK